MLAFIEDVAAMFYNVCVVHLKVKLRVVFSNSGISISCVDFI